MSKNENDVLNEPDHFLEFRKIKVAPKSVKFIPEIEVKSTAENHSNGDEIISSNLCAYDARKKVPDPEQIVNQNKVSIDSILINIPTTRIKAINSLLSGRVAYIKAAVDSDDEVCDILGATITDVKQSKDTIKCNLPNGASISFGYRKVSRRAKVEYEDKDSGEIKHKMVTQVDKVVQVAISSKILGADYHKGISHENLSQVVEAINSTGMIEISRTGLESAFCWDVDIKKDFVIRYEPARFIRELYDARDQSYEEVDKDFCKVFGVDLVVSRKRNKGETDEEYEKRIEQLSFEKAKEAKKKGIGIQFGYRKNSLHPLYKFYDKGLELCSKSDDFREQNLKHNDYKGIKIIREELNIPTQKYARSIGLIGENEKLTVGKLMELTESQSELTKVLNDNFDKYFWTDKRLNDMGYNENEENRDKIGDLPISKLTRALALKIYDLCSYLAQNNARHLAQGAAMCLVKDRPDNVITQAQNVINKALQDVEDYEIRKKKSIDDILKVDNLPINPSSN